MFSLLLLSYHKQLIIKWWWWWWSRWRWRWWSSSSSKWIVHHRYICNGNFDFFIIIQQNHHSIIHITFDWNIKQDSLWSFFFFCSFWLQSIENNQSVWCIKFDSMMNWLFSLYHQSHTSFSLSLSRLFWFHFWFLISILIFVSFHIEEGPKRKKLSRSFSLSLSLFFLSFSYRSKIATLISSL